MDAQKLTNFLVDYGSRDKVSKFFQCAARIQAYYLYHKDKNDPNCLLLTEFAKAASDARKFFRVGRFLYEYTTIVKALTNKNLTTFQRYLTVVSKTCWFFYWFWDNCSYLYTLKLLKVPASWKPWFDHESARGWFYGCICEITQVIYDWTKLLDQKKSLSAAEYNFKNQVCAENLLKQISDILTAVHYFGVYKWNAHVVNFWGLLNAYLSCHQGWRRA